MPHVNPSGAKKVSSSECSDDIRAHMNEIENLRGYKVLKRLYDVAVDVEAQQMQRENQCSLSNRN